LHAGSFHHIRSNLPGGFEESLSLDEITAYAERFSAQPACNDDRLGVCLHVTTSANANKIVDHPNQGRIASFFCLIRSILNTTQSANARLVNWLRFLSDASVVSQRGNP